MEDIYPRLKEIDDKTASLSEQIRGKVWEVVGGGDKGGIVVREGQGLQSTQLPGRLATGALVRELALVGERLQYQVLEGDGPSIGWISLKLKGADLIVKAEKHDLQDRIKPLIKRLAMLPPAVSDVRHIDVESCLNLTEKLYGKKGNLDEIGSDQWCNEAILSRKGDIASAFPGFPAADPLLTGLIADTSLRPLQRVFPKPPRTEDEEPHFVKTVDAVDGLLPDAMIVAYFLSKSGTLRGALRYGPQAAGTMARLSPEDEGEFSPTTHGGATACVLCDAAFYLARLTLSAAATPKKITCQLSHPVPLFHTLEIDASTITEGSSDTECSVKVRMKDGKLQLAHATIHFIWEPMERPQLPDSLPRNRDLGSPCLDWVPPELAIARFPKAQKDEGWDPKSYKAAAFDEEKAMKFPKSCRPHDDATRNSDMKMKLMKPHVRANRPPSGGSFRSDLAYAVGLAPAAMSYIKWYGEHDNKFDGLVKFGPQASDAWYLEDGEHASAEMAMVAHYGIVLSVLDEFAAHIPRVNPGVFTLTWMLEMEVHHTIPIGHELKIIACLNTHAQAIADTAHVVTAKIKENNVDLVTAKCTVQGSV